MTVRDAVSFHGVWGLFDADGKPKDAAGCQAAATAMLDQLTWWGQALRDARQRRPYAAKSDLPDIDRPDARIAVVRQFPVAGPGPAARRCRRDAGRLGRSPWPDGLIARTCYVSTDAQRVLTYEQWSSDPLDVAEPDAIAFRLYRSGVRDDAPVPGCIVIVEVGTDGDDTARRWVDAVFDALAAETTLHPGGISGHFHISVDGTRVLNYAEWVDEASHVQASATPGPLAVGRRGDVCRRCPVW